VVIKGAIMGGVGIGAGCAMRARGRKRQLGLRTHLAHPTEDNKQTRNMF
jgi:hypothetical protein